MKNIKNMQGMTAQGGVLRALIALGALCFTTHAAAAEGDVILNEWSAVGPNKYLQNGECDIAFDCEEPGNGGDWVELVVIKDDMDMRGVTLDYTNDDGIPKTGSITFASTGAGGAFWEDNPLPAGTIIVIRDGATTNITLMSDLTTPTCSTDPNGSWDEIIEIDSNDTTFIAQTGFFNPDNDGWRMMISNGAGLIQNWVGEPTSCVICTGGGINSEEVGKLEEDPSADAAVWDPVQLGNYQDGNSSTYGAPNQWDNWTTEQCFDALTGCGTCPSP